MDVHNHKRTRDRCLTKRRDCGERAYPRIAALSFNSVSNCASNDDQL